MSLSASELNSQAEHLITEHKYNEALSLLDDAISANFHDSKILYNRGVCLVNLKKYQDALDSFSRAIELDPKMDIALSYRAWILKSQFGNVESALSDYTKAIEANPKYINALNSRGLLYETLDKYDEALADYNTVLSIDPKNTNALNNKALIHLKESNYDAAIDVAQKIAEADPNYPFLYSTLAMIYLSQGKLRLAEENALKSIEKHPQTSRGHYVHGKVQEQMQQFEKAIQNYTKFLELGHYDTALINEATEIVKTLTKKVNREKLTRSGTHDVEIRYDVFLSHYQRTGGLLAMVLKLLLEQQDPNLRIFLDVDDLESIHDLKSNIYASSNVVLLLTEGVFQRRFVLEEITAAIKANKNIILVWDKERCPWPEADQVPTDVRDVLLNKAIIWNAERDFRKVVVEQLNSKMKSKGLASLLKSSSSSLSISSPAPENLHSSKENEQLREEVKQLREETKSMSQQITTMGKSIQELTHMVSTLCNQNSTKHS